MVASESIRVKREQWSGGALNQVIWNIKVRFTPQTPKKSPRIKVCFIKEDKRPHNWLPFNLQNGVWACGAAAAPSTASNGRRCFALLAWWRRRTSKNHFRCTSLSETCIPLTHSSCRLIFTLTDLLYVTNASSTSTLRIVGDKWNSRWHIK